MKGAPVRIDLGPRDLEDGTAVLVRRDNLEKSTVQIASVVGEAKRIMAELDRNLQKRSSDWMRARINGVTSIDEVKDALNKQGGIVEATWCGDRGCGEDLEAKVDARILGTPHGDDEGSAPGGSCVNCGVAAESTIRIARSY